MSNDKIRKLLDELTAELKSTDLDSETGQAMQKLNEDIRELLSAPEKSPQQPSVMEQAQQLEVRFATEHPVAERLIQEVIDILSKLGI